MQHRELRDSRDSGAAVALSLRPKSISCLPHRSLPSLFPLSHYSHLRDAAASPPLRPHSVLQSRARPPASHRASTTPPPLSHRVAPLPPRSPLAQHTRHSSCRRFASPPRLLRTAAGASRVHLDPTRGPVHDAPRTAAAETRRQRPPRRNPICPKHFFRVHKHAVHLGGVVTRRALPFSHGPLLTLCSLLFLLDQSPTKLCYFP